MNKHTIHTFLSKNKNKLLFAVKFVYSVIFILIFIILSVLYFINQLPAFHLLIKIGIGALIFPAFLILIILVTTIVNLDKKLKVFKTINSVNYQVSNTHIKEDTKWFFTDFAKMININKHEIICFIDDLALDTIQFKLSIHIDAISKKQKLLNHRDNLQKENIYLSPYFDFVTKTYKIKQFKKLGKIQLEKELLSFVNKIETQYF